MENSIGLKRVNIYTSLPGKVNPFSNIEIHFIFLSCISLFRIALILHITNIIPIETSYSTLPNKSFAQVIKMNLYVSKLFRHEISDEKRPSQ